jgi:tripartite-type tricarboxylate transporter receptor subunit TctC
MASHAGDETMPLMSKAWLTRRGLIGSGLAIGLASRVACAFPTRPIRIAIGFGPGGLADIIVRLVAQELADRISQQVVVDNRPGAGGAIAAQAVAGAVADGHTLIVFTSGTAISKALFRSLSFDPVVQFTPVTSMAFFDALLMAPADGPVRSIADLRARGSSQPLTIGTLTAGTTQYLTGEMFRLASNLPITLVPFRTSPEVLTALRRRDVDLVIESYGAAAGEIKAGTVRVLASTGKRRSRLTPEVPTISESGFPDCVMDGWNAIFAPAGTPREVIELLNASMREIIGRPAVQARLLELGVEGGTNSPEEMARLLQTEIALWNSVVDRAGIERQ